MLQGYFLFTRYPEGLASALTKFKEYSHLMKAQSKAITHLYISNPLGSSKVSNLFSTYPHIRREN